MVRIGLILGGSLFLNCCTPQVFDGATLKKLGISSKPSAPRYPFDEFYKTGQIHSFAFTPDKSAVYFLKKDDAVENVFEYNFSSKKISQVTHYPETVSAFLVDPKGKFLIIQKDTGGSEIYDLYRFDLLTKTTTALTNGKNIERSFLCDIAKDGSRVYFSQSRNKREAYDVKVYDLVNKKASMLASGNGGELYCRKLNESNTLLTISRFVDNNELHLGLLDLSTGKVTYVLSEKAVKNEGEAFGRDQDLFFLSTKESDSMRLWRYDIATSRLELAKTDISSGLEEIDVFSKGHVSSIKYRGELAPKTKIYDGIFEKEKRLPFAADKIKGVVFHPEDSNLGILVVQEAAAPIKYYAFVGGKADLIYDSNQSAIKNEDFAMYHSLFVSSFDQTRIPVHYFIPNGTSSNNKKPVAFWIHGGPEDHVDPEYSSIIQFIVNQGFIVVAPNVRGSTGFGKKYQFMDNNDWGGAHIKDIVAVAEFTKNLDFVDRENVFILGGSFGGFSVMSLITQYPQVFKAAVDIFGLIELSSFMKAWSALGQAYWIQELGFDPRVDKVRNEQVSPIFHIDRIAVPLQVHQGANDIRVLKSQSDKLVSELKKRGKSVDYFVYPDEGHGFTKFANSKACFTRITDFFHRQVSR